MVIKMKKTDILKLAMLLLVCCADSTMAQVATLPVEFEGKQLYIPVRTGSGTALDFVFDTGSVATMIDSVAAVKAGLSQTSSQEVNVAGSGGAQNYVMLNDQRLALGKAEISGLGFVVSNLGQLSVILGRHLDGIVGYDVLTHYVVRLDFDRKALSLYTNIADADTTGYTGIPFEFNRGVMIPRFPISITLANGETFTGRVMFDTGNAATLLVSTPFALFHDFDNKLGKTIVTKGRGLSAETVDKLAVIRHMSFDGFDFGRMMIKLTVNPQAKPADGYLGILGIDVIKHFNVILDYADKKIYLKPNNTYNEEISIPAEGKPLVTD